MRDWRKIDKTAIFKGNDENGNRYLSQFLKEYQETFHPDLINAGCERCLEDYYRNTIKHLSTMSKSKNSGYKLKAKYEGIQLEFGSRVHVFNSSLTDEIAEKLIKKHPAGKDLFETVPEQKKPEAPKKKKLTDHTRPELDAMAEELGINPKDYSNKDEVAAAIEDVQAAQAETDTDPNKRSEDSDPDKTKDTESGKSE